MNSSEDDLKTTGRKSKDICKQRLSTNYVNDSESDNFEESQYDSDADPEFKCSEASRDNEDSVNDSRDDNDSDVCPSDISDFNATFDMLTNVLNSQNVSLNDKEITGARDLMLKKSSKRKATKKSSDSYGESSDSDICLSDITDFNSTFDMLSNVLNSNKVSLNAKEITSAEDMMLKTASKRKITEECRGIYGLAQQNFWVGKIDEALEYCLQIMKEYPRFPDTYGLLAQIYEKKGDHNKAEQLNYIAAMCNPKDTNTWIVTIDSTKEREGIEKAIERAKLAVSRTGDSAIRERLIELLEEAGHIKEAMIRRLTNIESTPVTECPIKAGLRVEDLIGMSEQFEALKDDKRAAKCREIIDLKYPQFLDDRQRIELLRQMVTVGRFGAILRVAGKIQGVLIKSEMPRELLTFTDDISAEYRRQVLVAVITAAVHLKISVFIRSDAFTDFIEELINEPSVVMEVATKLFEFKYFQTAINVASYMTKNSDESSPLKLEAYKLLGQSQEQLGENEAALATYDTIVTQITDRDAFVWEMKANLLYRMKRKEDAIQVLANCQDLIRDGPVPERGPLASRNPPTQDGARLLFKLAQLLQTQNRLVDFVRVAWKYVFLDSRAFFSTGNLELSCEDLVSVRAQISELRNAIWLCLAKTTDERGHCAFESLLTSSRSSEGPARAWEVLEALLEVLATNIPITGTDNAVVTDNSDLIELLAQWGLVLHKVLNWTRPQRVRLAAIYVVSALNNRLANHRIRLEVSGFMMFQELRALKEEFGERNQFWNLYHMCCHIMGYTNNRYILRAMNQTSNLFPLELINAGQVLTTNSKLSLAVHARLCFQNRENPQLCLQMAITLINSALSRNCRDTIKAMMLAVGFLKQYRQLRGACQETYYNVARFYQRIGIDDCAVTYYKKCLDLPPVGNTPYEQSLTDLSRDAAFNLILIYKSRNNKTMASYLRHKYLSI